MSQVKFASFLATPVTFDQDDIALQERMITIPHRSRFYPGQVPDLPHSYPADPNIKQSFEVWRPYFLLWCLDGLKMYHDEGFRHIPPSCQQFKQDLVAEKDAVMDFLDTYLEPGEPTDFVQLKELYNQYDAVNRALQRDKKTKKDSKAFKQSALRVRGNAFKEQHNFTVLGKSRNVRSVFVGYRYRQFEL